MIKHFHDVTETVKMKRVQYGEVKKERVGREPYGIQSIEKFILKGPHI